MLAESFSRLGVPVFAADIKGDLSGVARPGKEHPKVSERISAIGIEDHAFSGSPVLLQRITQVVRLIRSKGVGVFFVTQYPNDVPEQVIGQLGNRIQHALRAFTPNDRKALRAAAQTFRPNPAFDTEDAIGELGVGEALVSTLDAKGVPTMVERTLIAPPRSRIGPVSVDERQESISRSPLRGLYDNPVDRESAFELLKKRAEEMETLRTETTRHEAESPAAGKARGGSQRQGVVEAFTKSVMRSIGSNLGRSIARGVLGSMLGRR